MCPLLPRCIRFLVTAAVLPLGLTATPVPTDPSVLHGRLENGLTYYLVDNATPAEHVELRLVVDVGSAEEEDDQVGAAHLLEHLCFRGTPSFPSGELVGFFESLGVDFGPHLNAFTSFDETVYRLSLPLSEDRPETLPTALRILREWAGEVSFDPDGLETERGVVLAEWRERLGPTQRMLRQALPVLYPESPYAHRLPIGNREAIETVSAEAMQRFYEQWYRADRMAVIVVGAIDPEAVEKSITQLFADLPASNRAERGAPDPALPPPGLNRLVTADAE